MYLYLSMCERCQHNNFRLYGTSKSGNFRGDNDRQMTLIALHLEYVQGVPSYMYKQASTYALSVLVGLGEELDSSMGTQTHRTYTHSVQCLIQYM